MNPQNESAHPLSLIGQVCKKTTGVVPFITKLGDAAPTTGKPFSGYTEEDSVNEHKKSAPGVESESAMGSCINTHTVACPPTECKPMDPVGKCLSLMADVVHGMIDLHREDLRQALENPEQLHPPEVLIGFLNACKAQARGFQIQSSATAGHSAQEPPSKSLDSSQPEGGAL